MSVLAKVPRDRRTLLAGVGWGYLLFAYTLPLQGSAGLLSTLLRCPFRALTGIGCPLCGLTRSWHAILTGPWRDGLTYHPLGPELLITWTVSTFLLTLQALGSRGKNVVIMNGGLSISLVQPSHGLG